MSKPSQLVRHGGGTVTLDPYIGLGATDTYHEAFVLHVVTTDGAFWVDLDEATVSKLESAIALWRKRHPREW